MTREELQAMDQRCEKSQRDTRDALLRIEGYRKCLADLIEADVVAAERVEKDAATAAKQEKQK